VRINLEMFSRALSMARFPDNPRVGDTYTILVEDIIQHYQLCNLAETENDISKTVQFTAVTFRADFYVINNGPRQITWSFEIK